LQEQPVNGPDSSGARDREAPTYRGGGARAYDRRWWILALVVAIEAVVVLAVVGYGRHSVLGGDGPEYQRYATNIADHFAYSNAAESPFHASVFRTPGYPVFLAAFHLIVPGSLLLVRLAQFALIALAAVLLCRVARFVTTPGRAFAAGLICATFLPLVWLAAFHLTEALSTFLTVAVVLLIYLAMDPSEGRSALGIYALLGITTAVLSLVRPEDGLVLVPIAIGLMLSQRRLARRDRFAKLAVLLLAFVVVMAPWMIRNAIVANQFIPLGENSGQSLYISAEQYGGRVSYDLPPEEFRRLYGPNGDISRITGQASPFASPLGGANVEVASDDKLRTAARHAFEDLGIGQIVRDLPSRVVHLWGTADFPPPNRGYTTAIHRLAVAQWALILALAAVGLVIAIGAIGTRIWPLLLFPAYTTLVHLVFNVEARFTIPARPFLFVFAGIAVVSIGDRIRRWVRDRRRPVPVPA
jgi:4-amino-4-deoxy-L-arabinose transferase-like glycosyltransferase